MKPRFPFFRSFPLVFLLFAHAFWNCNRERDLVRIGMELESTGDQTQALYFYDLALKQNDSFPLAHKRMGSLLALSEKSSGIATYHLEKAWELDRNDLESGVRLYVQYLSIQKHSLAKDLGEDLKVRVSDTVGSFLDSLLYCVQTPDLKKWDGNGIAVLPTEFSSQLEPLQKFCWKKWSDSKQ